MQGQKGVVGSLPDTIGLPLLSPALPDTIGLPLLSNESTIDQQIFWNNRSNSANPVPHGNSMSLGGWSASSSSSPFNGEGSLLGLSQLEPVPGLPSFAESSNSQQAASRRDLNMSLEAENGDNESQIVQNPNLKSKTIEGQSSRNLETNVSPSMPSIGSLSTSIPTPTAHNISVYPPEHMNPRLSLAIGTDSEIPLTLNVSSGGNTGISHRNVRSRTNSSSRRQNEITSANMVENSNNGPQIQFSRFLSLNGASERVLPTDSTISRRRAAVGQRRTPNSSRWNRGSSSRQHVNPQPTFAVSFGPGESSTISNSTNLDLSGGNLSGSSSRSASPPIWFPSPPYPGRRYDLLHQSLAAAEFAPVRTPNLQETEISTGVGEIMLPQSRQVNSTSGLPYILRTPVVASAANARRSRIMNELRNALDLMRSGGDGLRAEDVMFLQQSMFFRMADAHRDMRLDVDNMSYEELLALEDRIGYVSTGLSEESITNQLKKRKYFTITMDSQTELEPCVICQEEYSDGKEIGTLDCGHEFHACCIKQWLTHKNLCPICKATGLDSKNNKNSS